MTELSMEEIRERIESGLYATDAGDSDNWGYVLGGLCHTHTRDTVRAFTLMWEDHHRTPLDASDFAAAFERTERGVWETPGAFARHEADEWADMGDDDERLRRRAFLDEFGDDVDWEARARRSGPLDDYALVMLDPESGREVHVFNPDA